MRSTHNTIRALAIGLGLTLLVITGTAAMMAAFSTPAPATDMYRRVAMTPSVDPVTHVATAHDSVLYERVILPDGQVQWVLTDAQDKGPAIVAELSASPATVTKNNTTGSYSAPRIGDTGRVNYTLAVKPAGLSKAVRNCSRSAYDAYDIACNTLG